MTRREQMICGLLEGGRVMREILWKKIDGYDYAVSTSGEVKRPATKASSGPASLYRYAVLQEMMLWMVDLIRKL